MPEEVQSTEQQTLSKETPVKTSHKINWLHVVLGVIAGIILLGMGFGVYLLTQSKDEPSVTSTKVATSSAKQATSSTTATPSADKDETANWKVYLDSVIKFSMKHPKDWTVNTKTTPYYEVEIINYDPSESLSSGFSLPEGKGKVKLSVTKDTKSESASLEDYVISNESKMTTTVSKKEISLDDKKAIKRVWEQEGFGTHATTYIEKDSSTVFLVTEFLHYQENLYDLLISTFKFLPSQ